MRNRVKMISLVILSLIAFVFCGMGQAAPDPQKTLMIAVGGEPYSLDPSLAGMGSGADAIVVENWGEYLIHKMPNGDLTPGIAESWKMSPDGKTIDFMLRKGVKFHSGDPLTASDVKFSFDRGIKVNRRLKDRMKNVKEFEIIDDYHIRFHMKKTDVTIIPLRGGFMIGSKRYFDRVGEDAYVKQPSCTGPYKMTKHMPGQYIELERFEDFWGKKPPVKKARFMFVSEDTTRIAKLKAGEVDFIQGVPWPMAADIEKTKGLKIVKLANHHPTRAVAFSTLNPKAPWADRRVRMAMALAIDSKGIVKNLLGGIPNLWPWIAPGELGYDPSIKPYPYDPESAKKMLAEAGYPNGFDFPYYYPISGRLPMTKEIVEAVAAYLGAVGIRTKLIGQETASFNSTRRAARKEHRLYASYSTTGLAGAVDPSYNLWRIFSKDSSFSTYYNLELEKLIAQSTAEVDDEKRAALIRKALKIIRDDVPAIPIFNNVALYAMKENVDFNPTLKLTLDLVQVKDITLN